MASLWCGTWKQIDQVNECWTSSSSCPSIVNSLKLDTLSDFLLDLFVCRSMKCACWFCWWHSDRNSQQAVIKIRLTWECWFSVQGCCCTKVAGQFCASQTKINSTNANQSGHTNNGSQLGYPICASVLFRLPQRLEGHLRQDKQSIGDKPNHVVGPNVANNRSGHESRRRSIDRLAFIMVVVVVVVVVVPLAGGRANKSQTI